MATLTQQFTAHLLKVKVIKICLLCILGTVVFATPYPDDLSIKYIANTVEKYQAEAFAYKRPENAYQYMATNQTPADYGTFDYIIVGAGSAGAVLATRLSENENLRILLLEAGGHPSTFTDIPAMIMFLQGSDFNWNFKSIPQTTSCLGMVDQKCPMPRGKGYGGTSILNALMYVRGNKYDFDSWARDGNKGWSYKEVLPYFIKSENSQIDGDYGYHGHGGLINVEYHSPYSPVFDAFIDANIELGRKIVDYNGKEQLGVAAVQSNTRNGRRDNTGKTFLLTAVTRRSLKLIGHSYVKKVLINRRKEAYGVLFDKDGQAYYAHAKKEVILSAGAISSPQLLMLSGIGPSKILRPLNIPVISELPVGENYQDHPTYFGLMFTTNHSEPIKTVYEYSRDFLKNYGPFTIPANTQGVGFFRTKSAKTPEDVPNIELILIPQVAADDFTQQAFNYNDESYNAIWGKMDKATTFAVFVMLLHPKSRGTVQITSANPYEYPSINNNFLSDELNEDIQELYEGINLAREMMETKAFKKLDAKLFNPVLPACSSFRYLSKEQWFCQLRQLSMHIYHPVGTCKMASHPSKGGVVNHELKVHGVKKLRVVDTSIIPDSPSGHLNAPAIMIGEKIADEIKHNL